MWKWHTAEGDETAGVENQFHPVADVELPLAKVTHISQTTRAKLLLGWVYPIQVGRAALPLLPTIMHIHFVPPEQICKDGWPLSHISDFRFPYPIVIVLHHQNQRSLNL